MEYHQPTMANEYFDSARCFNAVAAGPCTPPPSLPPPAFIRPPAEFSNPAATYPMIQYSPPPQVVYLSQQPAQPADSYPYFYYTGHTQRHSPDLLVPPAKLSPTPPTPHAVMPLPANICYPPYPPCFCCSQMHYQHQPYPVCYQEVTKPTQLQPSSAPTAAIEASLLESPTTLPSKTIGSQQTTNLKIKHGGSWSLQHQQQQQQQQQRRKHGYMHNILFKTELCRDVQDGGTCPRGRACQFAHSPVELHDPQRHPLYKTAFCYDFKHRGQCPRGELCFHAHESAELRQQQQARQKATSRQRRGQEQPGTSAPSLVGNGSRRRNSKPRTAAGGAHGGETPYRYLIKKLGDSSSKGGKFGGGSDIELIETKVRRLRVNDGES